MALSTFLAYCVPPKRVGPHDPPPPTSITVRLSSLNEIVAGAAVFINPTIPITGVGQIASPRVSLYKLTLPPVIGVSKCRQASAIPSIDSTSCAMISGRSGFPKFRLLVAATGTAPTVERFRQHSATINRAPSRGDNAQYRALPSSDIAMLESVSFIRTIAASPPGPASVFVRTV